MSTETKPAPAEPEPPKFESDLAKRITDALGDKITITSVRPDRIAASADAGDIIEAAESVRDIGFDHAESVTGVDYPEDGQIEVVYHLGSYTNPELGRQVLELSTRAPREENPRPGHDSTKLPSLRDIFYSVEFGERECFEMLGVYFEGHPDNRRLLLPEDWADLPPLRKDFKIKGR